MRVLLWHVHGSWTDAFVRGDHEYLLPVVAGRGPQGRGRALTWDWPTNVFEVPAADLATADVDVVVLQRPSELDLLYRWTNLRAGLDVPSVYVEHNTPPAPFAKHVMADQQVIPLVHVTHFNNQIWDGGIAPTRVIEHGVQDPGHRYTAELPHSAVVINEPARRGRAVGADLLEEFACIQPLELFGLATDEVASPAISPHTGLSQAALNDELPRCAVYLHPFRWTSLGLSLIEAMLLGMPVVALDATEASRAVPREAGVVSNDMQELLNAIRRITSNRRLAMEMGAAARASALIRYPLDRFLDSWDAMLAETLQSGGHVSAQDQSA